MGGVCKKPFSQNSANSTQTQLATTQYFLITLRLWSVQLVPTVCPAGPERPAEAARALLMEARGQSGMRLCRISTPTQPAKAPQLPAHSQIFRNEMLKSRLEYTHNIAQMSETTSEMASISNFSNLRLHFFITNYISSMIIWVQKNKHKFHVLDFGLSFALMTETWWSCYSAWFENDLICVHLISNLEIVQYNKYFFIVLYHNISLF